ncbi:MAG: hypothetical protein HUK22_05875, partial [Thermoguttaceae bacterium]|nr:hypothetical protein [Thermoguttaceae bacterium]
MANVFVALSGGVDSGVAALRLLERGDAVRGIYMRRRFQATLDVDESLRAVKKWGAGVNLRFYAVDVGGDLRPLEWSPELFPLDVDAASALELAAYLGIELTIVDVDSPFAEIVENFVDEYYAARTPNPCVLCNRKIKFGVLFDAAARLGAEKFATGHYVCKRRVVDWAADARNVGAPAWLGVAETPDEEFVERSQSVKDQSYFLYSVPAATLRRVEFPIGEFEKPQVREIAQKKGLPVAMRKDSQEVCFVPDKARLDFIRQIRASNPPRWSQIPDDTSGNFISLEGKVIGRHAGYEKFTVGQRKGLGMGFCERIFVQRVNPETREVVLGPYDALATNTIRAIDANWHARVPIDEDFRCEIKIRYRNESIAATVRATS